MNISDIAAVVAISGVMASGAGTAGKFYLDTQYVGNDTIIELELRQLKREVRKLERIDPADITEQDQWYLEDLQDEIEDLEDELS